MNEWVLARLGHRRQKMHPNERWQVTLTAHVPLELQVARCTAGVARQAPPPVLAACADTRAEDSRGVVVDSSLDQIWKRASLQTEVCQIPVRSPQHFRAQADAGPLAPPKGSHP
eukprot:CAMPEP_0170178052 /NCGR_PEP_ID=MMETSP0040_2-20121228/11638_1 /TAXON_ID=641309 /ORGANISM="Lotharella oceanica, Strain CCMP622" /LENGTH=113 /DNA_ID=CAMNT_0010421003 /DNA_START=109 /DNA_END=451 /DNA_ORIENTATION=+